MDVFYYLRVMKKIVFAISVILLSALCLADTPQRSYIEKYSGLAIEEMYRTGVPASITLAQGLLESGYGLSELAVKGNNHFGIKCHNTPPYILSVRTEQVEEVKRPGKISSFLSTTKGFILFFIKFCTFILSPLFLQQQI